jgi:glycosyltransferase involved in cell wall biosynthesis
MNKMPTLSVGMCNYNYAQFIGEALESIFRQSFLPMEVIIVDDGSTDNSVEVIEKYMKLYSNIKLFKNERNMGVNYSINRCLSNAAGDYYCPVSSDDILLPAFFERSTNLLIKYPHAGLCFSDWAIKDKGKLIEMKAYLSEKPCYFSPDEFENILLHCEYTVIGGISVVAKRAALIEAGGYMPELKAASDVFMNHVVSLRYGACYFPEIVAVLRRQKDQYSSKKFRPIKVEMEIVSHAMDILLTPKYADVLAKFKRATPFSHCSWDVLKLVLSNKKYREFFSMKLLRYALFDRFIRRILLFVLPMDFWRIILGRYRSLRFQLSKLFRKGRK